MTQTKIDPQTLNADQCRKWLAEQTKPCPACKGQGDIWLSGFERAWATPEGFEQCRLCNGTGRVPLFQGVRSPCPCPCSPCAEGRGQHPATLVAFPNVMRPDPCWDGQSNRGYVVSDDLDDWMNAAHALGLINNIIEPYEGEGWRWLLWLSGQPGEDGEGEHPTSPTLALYRALTDFTQKLQAAEALEAINSDIHHTPS